jgi:hypothetical protein
MVLRPTSKRCMSLLTSATLFLLGSFAHAQQPAHSATAPASGGHAPSAERPSQSRATHTGHGGIHPSAQDAPAPPPSFAIPGTVTPHWEIPNYIPVEPNQVQGHPRDRRGFGGPLGGFVGYGAAPDYSFLDSTSSDDQSPDVGAGPVAPPPGPGPAGYPPDYAAQGGYPQGEPEPGFIAPRAPYRPDLAARPAAPPQSAVEVSDGLDHPEITLIFHDGRPPLKIHSYALTGTSLLAIENGHQTRIPLADLDLSATEERNRANGVDFSVPASR